MLVIQPKATATEELDGAQGSGNLALVSEEVGVGKGNILIIRDLVEVPIMVEEDLYPDFGIPTETRTAPGIFGMVLHIVEGQRRGRGYH